MDALLQQVSTYGYVAVFGFLMLGIIALPVPDEWLLVFSGYLVYSGRLNAPGTFAAALLGSICGITASYWIGRKFGLPVLHSRLGRMLHVTDDKIARVNAWFHRAGHWSLFFGYYIPGARHLTALVAGASALEYRPFALYAYAGAAGWVSIFLFIGYHFGERWQSVLQVVEHHIKLAAGIGAGVLCAYLLFQWARRKRKVP